MSQDKSGDKNAPAAFRGKETVLFVDDEDSLRRLGERVLRENGYTVLTAPDGPEALKTLERHGKPVDILITDMVMPGMGGRELAREAARRNASRRTLYLSGNMNEDAVQEGGVEGGAAFLHKPFTLDALLRKMREVLDSPVDGDKAED